MSATHASSEQPADDALTRAARSVEQLVPNEDNAANRVGGRQPVRLTWAGVFCAVCGFALVPWIAYLAATLPSHALSPNYDIAWTGFDVLLCLALLLTGASVLRRSRWMPTAAAFTAALLVTDAWFDVVTSHAGAARMGAIALAVLVELPLAALCLWMARFATDATDRRIEALYRHVRVHRRR